jgi:hypothetical protein
MVEAPNSPGSPDTGEISDRPIADAMGRPIVEDASLEEQIAGTEPQEAESDEEDSGDEEEASHDRNVTVGLTELGSAGQILFCADKCLVQLASKVQGHNILCGYTSDGCKRPKHQELRGIPTRVGVVGIYNATPNVTGAVLDAIEETFISEEDLEAQHQDNRRRLEALGGSVQKRQDETTGRDQSPTQVRFDTTPKLLNNPIPTGIEQPSAVPASGTPEQPRRDQICEWVTALTPDTEPVLRPVPVRTTAAGHPEHSGSAGEVPLLLQTLLEEFKGMKEGMLAHPLGMSPPLVRHRLLRVLPPGIQL